MRADRLLAIMLLLQRGGRMTASDLAERLEVSVRTIYRDLEALAPPASPSTPSRDATAGSASSRATPPTCPVSRSRRPSSCRCWGCPTPSPGSRSDRRCDGRRPSSSWHCPTTSASGPSRPAGASTSTCRAGGTTPSRSAPAHAGPGGLRGPAAAVPLQARPGRVSRRPDFDPLGLVVQGAPGTSSDARGRGAGRIYRVSRIEHAEILAEPAVADDEFDLVAFWLERKEDFHMTRSGYQVRCARSRGRCVRCATSTRVPFPR